MADRLDYFTCCLLFLSFYSSSIRLRFAVNFCTGVFVMLSSFDLSHLFWLWSYFFSCYNCPLFAVCMLNHYPSGQLFWLGFRWSSLSHRILPQRPSRMIAHEEFPSPPLIRLRSTDVYWSPATASMGDSLEVLISASRSDSKCTKEETS